MLRQLLGRHALPVLAATLFGLPLWFLVSGSLRPVGLPPPAGFELLPPSAFLEPDQPPESSQVFVDAIPDIRAVPHTANWSRVEKEADNVLESVFYGRVEREAGIRQLIESTRPLSATGGG